MKPAVRFSLLGALALVVAGAFALRLWYASPYLDATRWFDEQFSFRNVGAVLLEGGTRPSNAFYPSLSYWPQTAALWLAQKLAAATGWSGLAIRGDTPDGWSESAYWISRGLSALAGALSLVWVYRLGRRIFEPRLPASRLGLLAAALYGALEPHLFASAIFKPDALVALLTLLTFGWALSAAERPGPGRFALAGVGVGLATCAKYTGVGGAFAVAAAALALGGWRQRRRWGWLFLAGAASAATFVLLNPYLFVVVRYIPRLLKIADSRAAEARATPWTVAWRELLFLWYQHRPLVFAFAVAGLIGLGLVAFGARERLPAWLRFGEDGGEAGPSEVPSRLAAILTLAYVVGYSALYAWKGGLFRGQNYLPVAAFTSLAAAWAGLGVWDRLAARLPALGRGPWPQLGYALVLGALLYLPASASYVEVVPTTTRLAERRLAGGLSQLELRQVFYERGEHPMWALARGNPMAVSPVPALSSVAPQDLDRADAEIFFASRLFGPDAAFYQARRATERISVAPRFLRARGPALELWLHPWQPVGEPEALTPEPLPRKNRFKVTLARPLEPDERVSLLLWLRIERGRPRPGWMWLGGARVSLFENQNQGRRSRFLTQRVELQTDSPELEIGFERSLEVAAPFEIQLQRWRPPAD